MSASDWPLLDPIEEEDLHLKRLLSVDERPFNRVTKKLVGRNLMIHKFRTQLPTPPPDATEEDERAVDAESQAQDDEEARQNYHDDILFDFAQLEATLIRIQFLKDANERERARYAAEKSKILSTAEAVRVNTAELRIQLTAAQSTLALKKEYDQLAEAIFKDKSLKPRDVLEGENEKLKAEIEDLEQESRDFGGLWRERKDRFDRVVNEGKSLVRFIKGEKDEDMGEDEEESPDLEGNDSKGDASNVGTPRPEVGGATPMHTIEAEGDEGALAAQHALAQRAVGSSLRVPGTENSRASSVTPSLATENDAKDTEMQGIDEGNTSIPVAIEVEHPSESVDSADGQAGAAEEAMDTT